MMGLITLDEKRTGKRSAGNPLAPFDEAGAGDGAARSPRQPPTLPVGAPPGNRRGYPTTGNLIGALALLRRSSLRANDGRKAGSFRSFAKKRVEEFAAASAA